MDMELTKQYLENVIDLESKKVVTEKMFDELVVEEKEWNQRISYSASKGRSSLSLIDLIIIGAKVFGVSLIIMLIMGIVSEKLNSTFLNILLLFIMIVVLFILPIAIPIYMKIKEVSKISNDYNQQKKRESYIKEQGKKAIFVIANNKEKLREAYKSLGSNLDKVYSADIIYKKYQTFEACAAIFEYLASGRCYELEGPNGAYNKYEDEALHGEIITELKTINLKMDMIIKNQRRLEIVLRNIAKEITEMKEDIKAMCSVVQNIDRNIAEIAENTKISAWSSAVMATQVPDWHSEAMKKSNEVLY